MGMAFVSAGIPVRGAWGCRRGMMGVCEKNFRAKARFMEGPANGNVGRAVIRMLADEKSEMPKEAKAAKERGENVQYWKGEWICVDCGYIYKPNRKITFEDLPSTWKCPQCNAPKRRFAKKAGDFIAESAGTSNIPIIVFSVIGVVATIAFGIWANSQL